MADKPATWLLAKEFHRVMENFDPTDAPEWGVSDSDRLFYWSTIRGLMRHRESVLEALREVRQR